MSWFKSQAEIEAEMLSDLEDIAELKLSISDLSREEIIKIKQSAVAFSHAYAQIDRVADDFFPGSASEQALVKHLAARQMSGRELAQPSNGSVQHTGVSDTVIPAGTRIRRRSDGKLFYLLSDITIDSEGVALGAYRSVLTGQDQNIDLIEDDFDLVSPITGVDDACFNTTRFLDGRNLETPAEMLARIETHDQDLDSGGNLVAYERFAKAASDAVVTAHAVKNPRGPNTVDTIITSGTTDIEAAVLAGQSVERVPSQSLVDLVQAYILTANPTTDDHQTHAPIEDNFDTTVTYDLYDETLRSQVAAAINQVWQIFVYSLKSGQYADPTDLERRIDARVGHLIQRRRVSNFGVSTPQYQVPDGHILKPRTLTQASYS